jgi:MOSC domain-containing protein YiiM
MLLSSVNLGTARDVLVGNRTISTGIYKVPTANPVMITTEGVEGDTVTDKKNHAGPDQAVYVYGGADYSWWEQTLGRALEPGTFGENLTISDLESAPAYIGDRLQIGALMIEVTAPRIPCSVFERRMEERAWVKRFREGGRPGIYCRVIEAGQVCVGDEVTLVAHHDTNVTVGDIFRIYYNKDASESELLRILSAPIAIRARKDYQKRLEKLRNKAHKQPR